MNIGSGIPCALRPGIKDGGNVYVCLSVISLPGPW